MFSAITEIDDVLPCVHDVYRVNVFLGSYWELFRIVNSNVISKNRR